MHEITKKYISMTIGMIEYRLQPNYSEERLESILDDMDTIWYAIPNRNIEMEEFRAVMKEISTLGLTGEEWDREIVKRLKKLL